MFSKESSISSRVKEIIKSDIELKGEAWLAGLGYAESNDYAQGVVYRVSLTQLGIEHIRFETVARYIRDHKAAIRAKQEAAKASQIDTTTVAQ